MTEVGSQSIKSVAWVGGWGFPPNILRPLAEEVWPGASHSFFVPSALAAESALASDAVVGWSLGSLRLLDAAASGFRFSGRVFLLAPFLGFCAEHGCGGKTTSTQLKWLRRWMQREPLRALADFYNTCGVHGPTGLLPYDEAELLAGVERLLVEPAASLRAFASVRLPSGWVAAVGDADPLLDAAGVVHSMPGCMVVAGGDHRPGPLLRALKGVQGAV